MNHVKITRVAVCGLCVLGLGLALALAESNPAPALTNQADPALTNRPDQAVTNQVARDLTNLADRSATNLPPGAATNRPALWFPVGEQIFYKVQWGVWIVADTKVSSEYIEEDGRELLAIRLETKTRSMLSAFYPVDDFIESVVDPATFLPVRFTKRLSEGRYRLHEVTTFNHKARTAHWQHLLRNDSQDFAIDADTRDLISYMFFMRSQKFAPGKHYQFRVMADEKLYDLFVEARNIEILNIGNYEKIRTLKLDPEAKFHGLFVRVGKLEVWVSDDDRCLCVRATAKAPVIGTIRLLIDRVEGPGDDYWKHPGDSKYTQKARNPAEGLSQ